MTRNRQRDSEIESVAAGRLQAMGKKKARGRPRLNPGEKKDVPLQVRMPPELIAAVKAATAKEGTSMSELVRELLESWLKRRK